MRRTDLCVDGHAHDMVVYLQCLSEGRDWPDHQRDKVGQSSCETNEGVKITSDPDVLDVRDALESVDGDGTLRCGI